jgi:hypothetical protein
MFSTVMERLKEKLKKPGTDYIRIDKTDVTIQFAINQ